MPDEHADRDQAVAPADLLAGGSRSRLEPDRTLDDVMAGAEQPVSFTPRSRAAGKKIGWRDGIAAIRVLVRHRFSA